MIDFPEIDKLTKKKGKIIFFGTGRFAEKLISLFEFLGLKINYYIDNNKFKWNQLFHGVKIYNPEVLKEESGDDALVVVASTFYEDICNQLIEYNLEENKDVLSGEMVMRQLYAHLQGSIGTKQVIDYLSDKKVILYGADTIFNKLVPILNYFDLNIGYCVDPGASTAVDSILGIDIKARDILKQEDKNVGILIFSDDYYKTLEQLENYGFYEFKNCYNGFILYKILFENQEMISYILSDFSKRTKECYFIQIGANDGISHDHLRRFVVDNGWKGILVEPIDYIFEKLKNNYKNAEGLVFEKAAIANENGWKDFYYFSEKCDDDLNDCYSEYGSFVLEHIQHMLSRNSKSGEYLLKKKLPCITFNSLMKKNNISNFNVLCMDLEGYDYEILKSIDFYRYSPNIIVYEINHLTDEERLESFQLLKKHDYMVLEIGIDAVAIK